MTFEIETYKVEDENIIVAAALLYAHGFSDRNLHVIDVSSIPDGLENPVRKTERQNILNGLFSEIVIDSIDLFFVEHLADCFI